MTQALAGIEPASEPAPDARCQNCGTPLRGPYCFRCGQPVTGMVRQFSTIVGDFLDTVFDFDSRTLRTLGPLLLRPGYLSLEYFRGHRVRYVTPVRLFFFLCIAAFLLARFNVDAGGEEMLGDSDAIAQAEQVGEVERLRDDALATLGKAREALDGVPGDGQVQVDAGIAQVRDDAARRIAWLQARDEAQARGETFEQPYRAGNASGAASADKAPPTFSFNGEPWTEHGNPVRLGWLPEAANRTLNRLIGRAQVNLAEVRSDRTRFVAAFMETLPQSLFVLVPVFALVLKLAYLFSRRLYMEHLIVVLHSHAFLCAMLLVLVGLSALRGMLGDAGLLSSGIGWIMLLLVCWIPVYLLLAQKRVYGQGWLLTLVKFVVLGHIHFALVTLGVLVSLAVSLVVM